MSTSQRTLEKCQKTNIVKVTPANDTDTIWCQSNEQSTLRDFINSQRTDDEDEITDTEFMTMLGHMTLETKLKLLRISPFDEHTGEPKSDSQIKDDIAETQVDGSYQELLKHHLQAQIDPNRQCRVMTALLPNVPELRGWTVVELLGQGNFGTVLAVQKGLRRKAVKLIDTSKGTDWMTPEAETNLQKLAFMYDVGVGVEKMMKVSKYKYVIVMAPMDFTLLDLLKCIATVEDVEDQHRRLVTVIVAMRKLLLRMVDVGITHCDAHPSNWMCRVRTDGTLDLLLIDFGQSTVSRAWCELDVAQFLRGLEYHDMDREIIEYFEVSLNNVLAEVRGKMFRAVSADDFVDMHGQIAKYIGTKMDMQKVKRELKQLTKTSRRRYKRNSSRRRRRSRRR
jgi:hypothetical protein